MSQKDSLRAKQLKAAAKRRAKRPVAQFTPPAELKAKGNVERRMIRDHVDLLQNIEATLVAAARQSEDINDYVVELVLRAAITRTESDRPTVVEAVARLDNIRDIRPELTEELWTNGLQTIYSSLRRHSDCRPGDTAYLDFVDDYVW